MVSFYFNDLLRRAGIAPDRVKLIRHAFTDPGYQSCRDAGMLLEYTRQQNRGFSDDFDWWAIFEGEAGSTARFYGLYQVGTAVPDTPDQAPEHHPHPEWFRGENLYYELTHSDLLADYEHRLVIDWGSSVLRWAQCAVNQKPVLYLTEPRTEPFPGFDCLILSYDKLAQVVTDPQKYGNWQTALASVRAVYLITDTESGLQYVGGSYGENGLLGRWRYYITTLHGQSKRLKELLDAHPGRHRAFQFSVLQVLPLTAPDSQLAEAESLWKRRLGTRAFGLNDN